MSDSPEADIPATGWFGHRNIAPSPGDAMLGLSDGIAVEWKDFHILAGAAGGVTARPVIQDGIDCVEIEIPKGTGWVRLRVDLTPRAEDTLTGVRILMRLAARSGRIAPTEPLKALVGRRDATGIHPIGEGMTRISYAPGHWHNLTGAFIRPGGMDDHVVILEQPEDHILTLGLVETTDRPVRFDAVARQSLETAGLVALRPLRAERLTDEEARLAAAHAPVFAADAELDGADLTGWAVTDGPADIVLKGPDASAAPIRATTGIETELRPGLWAGCGFVADATPLLTDTTAPVLTCHLQTGTDGPPGPAFITLSAGMSGPGNRALAPVPRQDLAETGSISGDAVPVFAHGPPAVFVAPDITASDPYQRLLYRAMPGIEPRPGGLAGAMEHLTDPAQDQAPVLHLIALGPLLARAETAREAEDLARETGRRLAFLVHQGGQVIWTLRAPPEGPWPEAERILGQAVAALRGPVHLHCKSLVGPLALAWGIDLPPERCLVTPPGGTVGYYPDYATRAAARAKLGLAEDVPLFVLFGRLGGGKDIDAAVTAFAGLHAAHPEAHLMILGNTAPGERRGRIRRRFDGLPHVRVIESHTADNSLQWFLRAADWAVMPYREGHTPEALMTAMSFGLPVIAPKRASIAPLVPDEAGLLHDPEIPDGLEQSLFLALSKGQDMAREMGRAAHSAMAARSWTPTATALLPLLEKRIAVRTVTLDFEDRPRQAQLMGRPFPPETPARTAILVLNYENCEDTARLAASLREGTDQDFDLYVIDNGSPSVTVDELVQRFGDSHILRLPANLGYAAGNNAGLRLIAGLDYHHVLILNPDLTAPPDALERMVAAARAHDGPAVFGPALLRGGDPGRVASAGCFLDTSSGLATGHMYAGEITGALPQTPYEADFVTGAALFFSRSTLDRIGLLPEDYFLYFEESDWLIAAREAGVPSIVLPDIRLRHHKRSEEGGVPAPYFFYYYIRNSRLFARRLAAGRVASAPDPAMARARLHSDFISPWLERIRRAAPDRLDWFTALAERALADGEADRRGAVDLLAGQLSDADLPLADPGITGGLEVGFYTGGGTSPKIAGTLRLPPGAASTGPWRLSAVMHGKILGSAEAKRHDDEPADCLRIELPLPKEDLTPGRGQTVTLYLNGRKTGSVSAYLPYPPPLLEGKFVALGNHCCAGWLRNKANSDRPAIAEIWTGGRLVGRGPADLPVNQGECGFSIRLPRHLSDGTERIYELRAPGQEEVIAEASLSDKIGRKSVLNAPADRIEAELFYRQEMWFGAFDPDKTGVVGHFRDRAARLRNALDPGSAAPVTIGLPVLDSDDMAGLSATIDSVLAQTHQDWELCIAAGDARLAETLPGLLGPDPDPRIRLTAPPKTLFSRAEARNLALEETDRPVIAHIDPGTTWAPDYLALQLDALAGGAQSVICGQWLTHKVLGPDGTTEQAETIGLRWSQPTLPRLENRPGTDIACLVMRRDLYQRLGGFDRSLTTLEDWDLMLRIADIAPPEVVPALLARSDVGAAPMRQQQDAARKQALERIAIVIDRLASRFGLGDRGKPPPPRITDMAVLVPDRDAVTGPDPAARIVQRLHDIAAAHPDPGTGRLLAVLPEGLAGPVRALLSDQGLPCAVELHETGSVQAPEAAIHALNQALAWRRETADLLLMRIDAMLLGGAVTGLWEAAARRPRAGILVPRHGIGGREDDARTHAPSSWRERDVCIAISHIRANLLDPGLDLAGSLVALSEPDPFCLCLLPEAARALAQAMADAPPTADDAGLDTLLGPRAAQACLALEREIVYCGRARAFEMPL